MIGIIYASKEKAVLNSFLYLREVEEDVVVYEVRYGSMNVKKEFVLKPKNQVFPDSDRIIFTAPIYFKHKFHDKDRAKAAAIEFGKQLGVHVVAEERERTVKRNGENVVITWFELVTKKVKRKSLMS